jgi:hypothetical protein
MGGRSVSADRRRAAAVALFAAMATAACTATSPPPLPPRRVDFPPQAEAPPPDGAAPVLARPIDLPDPAEPPERDERYMGWTLTADLVSEVLLVGWMGHPTRVYAAAPALLLVPEIHAAHGEFRSAGISLAMRAAMIGLVYLAGRTADRECSGGSSESICIPIGSFLLAETAIVVPMVIDSVFLARRRRPAPEWYRFPTLGAALDGDGRRLLTLGARF